MTTSTLTLADFLLARIAEDAQSARTDAADAMVGHRWQHYPREAYEEIQALTLAHAQRVLAECDAKRRMINEHKQVRDSYEPTDEDTGCQTCDWDSDCQVVMTNDGPGCLTVRLLALPYADHPDYDESWRP